VIKFKTSKVGKWSVSELCLQLRIDFFLKFRSEYTSEARLVSQAILGNLLGIIPCLLGQYAYFPIPLQNPQYIALKPEDC
jgi:hypothetical protein